MLTMAVDEAGNFGYQPLLEAMYAALLDMVEKGFIRAEEAGRMAIPTVGRSRADLVVPFAEDGCFAGLSIEQLETFLGEDRIWAQFEGGGDAHARRPMGRFLARFGLPDARRRSGGRPGRSTCGDIRESPGD